MYKDLKVYKRAYQLSLSLYRYCNTLPKEERYGLISQIKRASMSIPLNIAEGYGKGSSSSETNRYIQIARGSCSEIEVLISFCKDLSYMDEKSYERYNNEITEIGKMLYGLSKSIEEKTKN